MTQPLAKQQWAGRRRWQSFASCARAGRATPVRGGRGERLEGYGRITRPYACLCINISGRTWQRMSVFLDSVSSWRRAAPYLTALVTMAHKPATPHYQLRLVARA